MIYDYVYVHTLMFRINLTVVFVAVRIKCIHSDMFKYIKNNFEALDVFFNNAETHEGGVDDMIATNFVSLKTKTYI